MLFYQQKQQYKVQFLPTGGDSGDGRRRTLDALLSAVQFKPGRAAVGASQQEHEPAAKTYSGIFSPYRQRRPLAVRPGSRSVDMVKNEASTKQLTGGRNIISVSKLKTTQTQPLCLCEKTFTLCYFLYNILWQCYKDNLLHNKWYFFFLYHYFP